MAAAGKDVLVRRTAALLLLLPLLAACGATTSVSRDASPDLLADAVDNTTKAESSRMSFRVDFKAPGESGEMNGEGVFDYRRNAGQMKMDLSGLDQGMEDMEFIFDGDVIYMRGFDEDLPAGKSWMRVDTSTIQGAAQLGELGRMNKPAVELQYLRAASKEIEEKGREKVRGVETTRYHTVIDLSKLAREAAEEAPAGLRKQLRQEAKSFASTGIDELPTDVWIDAEGLLRKMTMDLSFQAEGEKVRMETSVELFDFGVPVKLNPPSAEETVDMSDLMQQGG
jgi:hypothetical protein